MALYIGDNLTAKIISNMYIGVNGVARRAERAYIGVGGVARQFFGPAATLRQISTYSVTGGTVIVTPGTGAMAVGSIITVTAVADEGYELESLRWNTTNISSGQSFIMPDANVAIAPTFRRLQQTISWDIRGADSISPDSEGWPTSANAGEHIELWTPYVDGQVPALVTLDGYYLSSTSGSQGGSKYEFTMPDHSVAIVVSYVEEDGWYEMHGWQEASSGGYWQDPWGEMLFWDIQQPPGGDGVLLRGTFYFTYQPIEPVTFVIRYRQDENDPWTDGKGNYVYVHGRYGTLDAIFSAMPGHDGWRLASLEWAYDN